MGLLKCRWRNKPKLILFLQTLLVIYGAGLSRLSFMIIIKFMNHRNIGYGHCKVSAILLWSWTNAEASAVIWQSQSLSIKGRISNTLKPWVNLNLRYEDDTIIEFFYFFDYKSETRKYVTYSSALDEHTVVLSWWSIRTASSLGKE